MEKFIKIAELKAADIKSLNRITKALEYAGFTIVYDKEYTHYAYVCVEEISNRGE